MKILITGATGLVGSKLLETLMLNGFDDIRILTTNKERAKKKVVFPVDIKEWNPNKAYIEKEALNDIDIIFHLAGENIADGKWTIEKKQRIRNSRILGTKLLLQEIKRTNNIPKKFISASAIGIYGNRGDETLTTDSSPGKGFLAEVCLEWEKVLLEHNIENMKVHALRTGIVLSNQGGALKKMLLPFKLGLGGKLGSGKQYMSWIHIDDLARAYIFLMSNDCKLFAYNAVTASPERNIDFTKKLAAILRRPDIMGVPAFALKFIAGELSQILLQGQRVIPSHFMVEGFNFNYPELKPALEDLLQYHKNGEMLFQQYQWVDRDIHDVFSFFSEAKNLERITPPYLNFKIVNINPPQIQTGTTIDFKLKIHGFPARWQSKIPHFEKDKAFIDEQVKGPYQKWVHLHQFTPLKSGTLILDRVVYKIPFGKIGKFLSGSFINKDINQIFAFRSKTIKEIL